MSEAGYLGRRGGVDLMVAMNPQTWDKDLAEIEPGGYLFYDSTRPLPTSKFRDDVHVDRHAADRDLQSRVQRSPPAPAVQEHHLRRRAVQPAGCRSCEEVEKLIGEQYKGKEKLLEPNIKALHMGRDYAREHLPAIGLKVSAPTRSGQKIFLEGNSAAALGCVYGGATVAAWYPITPSSSLAEAFARHCRKFRHDADSGKARYAMLQAEDELASIGMVIGAGWNGARAFTCTSGPGISLMQEFIGLAYFAEIPAVIFDVQRGGPVDRHADAHAAGRHFVLRLRLARRHQARAAVSRGSEGVLRVRGPVVRPGRSPADAGVRAAGSRHRHERAPVRAARAGTTRAATTAAR